MKNKDKDKVRLLHILEAIELIEDFSSGKNFEVFSDDKMMQSAVIRQFEIIGEATANLSDYLKENYPDVEWDIIKGFRNLLIHEYFRIDEREVWSAISKDIPVLKEQIISILEDF